MSNAISSLIFTFRNVDKTKNGEIGRAPVAAAQGLKVLDEVSHYNEKFAKSANAASSVFSNMAKQNKAVDYALKGTNWAMKNVNPLICVSGGLKVMMAEDKTSTAIKEVAALSTMFAGEAVAKKALPKLLTKINVGGKVGAILKGVLFVGASIGSYAAGEYMGKKLAKEVEANWSFPSKINQMA